MATHSGRSFLNSCLKVPLDPCNNCPAPNYNRPKMFLSGRTTSSRLCGGRASTSDAYVSNAEMVDTGGIRSLAKFYDSIPDYCELNHLPEAEFYSTLESLRSTSHELRTHATLVEATTSRSSTSLSTYCGLDKCKKSATTKKKKPAKKKPTNGRRLLAVENNCTKTLHAHPSIHISSTIAEDYTNCLRGLSRLNSFKQEFASEVADFRQSLKEFEQQFKRPNTEANRPRERPKSTSSNSQKTTMKPIEASGAGDRSQSDSKMLTSTATSPMLESSRCREPLKKSYSVNDLDIVSNVNIKSNKTKLIIETPNNYKTELSKYFPSKLDELPTIIVESPNAESSIKLSSNNTTARLRKKKTKNKRTESAPPPLSWLTAKTHVTTPSPVHPVARPNLAATLRAQVARRKVQELQNNCTYQDTTPQFDWEVRKTPAWKSLALNEPHKAILSLRLATRKAEQDLQRREYELHMEIMRQRVKSAPLLLEGETFWGPDVGKLTHNCQREGRRHTCESKQRKQRRKCSSTSSRCLIVPSDTSRSGTAKARSGSGDWKNSSKIDQLHNIYNSSTSYKTKCSSSNSITNVSGKRSSSSNRDYLVEASNPAAESGDDLCSVDRAFL